VYLFRSIRGYPDAPKQPENNYFLVVSDYFSYRNGPVDLVRVFFKLRHWDIHLTLLGTLVYLFRSIWECINAPKQHQTKFLVVLDHFFLKNGPNDMVRG
jgi:hypothetical protein